jgi:lysophospholipase L1-like esterase
MKRLLIKLAFYAAVLWGGAAFAQQINLQTQVYKTLLPVNGGFGINLSSSSGCPLLTSGTWTISTSNCTGGGSAPGGGNYALQYANGVALGGANFTGVVMNNGSSQPPTSATGAQMGGVWGCGSGTDLLEAGGTCSTGFTFPSGTAGQMLLYQTTGTTATPTTMSGDCTLDDTGAITCTNTPQAVGGALAEYPMLDGSGTTVTDVSGNGNNATFANGSNAPSWLTYGVAINNTGVTYSNNEWIDTPLTQFGSVLIASCTPTLALTSGTATGYTPVAYPTLIGSNTAGDGLFLLGTNITNTSYLSVQPTIYENGVAASTSSTGYYAGCHVYGYSLGTGSGSVDHITIDGVESPNYSLQGSSASSVTTAGHYEIGSAGSSNPAANSSRQVVTYAVFYPAGTTLTVAELAQESSYIEHQLSLRPTYPVYPVLNNAATAQFVAVGDSLTAGYLGSSAWTAGLSFNNSYTVTNYGIAGLAALDVCTMSSQRWEQTTIPAQTTTMFWAGTNDMANGAFTPAQTWASLTRCAARARADGIRSMVATMIDRSGEDSNKNALNALIRSNYKQAGFDYMIDLAAVPGLGADGASSNTDCFQGDGVHLTGPGTGTCGTITSTALSGYGIVEQLAENVVNTLDGSSVANPTVSSSNTFVMTYADNYTLLTPTAAATASLVDCLGQTSQRTLVNSSALYGIAVSGVNSETITGPTTVPPGSTMIFTPVLTGPATGGCSWVSAAQSPGVPNLVRSLGWSYGDVATSPPLTTSEVGYITVPFSCTITGWHIMANTGTVTVKTARIATGGTALPTLGSNSISTSGVSLSTGTLINSTTLTDFTSTAITAGDTLGFFITAVSSAAQVTFSLDCAQ